VDDKRESAAEGVYNMEYYVHSAYQKHPGKLTIGLIPENSANETENAMRTGVFEAAKKYNVNIICFTHLEAVTKNSISYGYEAEQYQQSHDMLQQLIEEFELDGLLFLGWSILFAGERLQQFQQRFSHIPIFSLGKELADIPSAHFNSEIYIKELVLHLIESHNYKKIVFVESWLEDERKFAYLETMKEHHLYNEDLFISSKDLEGVMLSERPQRTLDILMNERKIEFDAIILMRAEETRIMMEELKLRGMTVPWDVAVTSYEDDISLQYAYSPVTTIYFPFKEIGYTGCEQMIQLLTHGKIPLETAVPSHILYRESCGCMHGENLTHSSDYDKVLLRQNSDFQHLESSFLQTMESGSNEFLTSLQNQLKQNSDSFHNYQRVISALRNKYAPTYQSNPLEMTKVENLWHVARIMISQSEKSWIANDMITKRNMDQMLEEFSQSLLNTFSIPKIMELLEFNLGLMNIHSCNIFLSDSSDNGFKRSTHIYGFSAYQGMLIKAEKIVTKDYNHRFIQMNSKSRILVVSLLHVERNDVGFIYFEPGPLDGSLYLRLAIQLSNALIGTIMVDKLTQEILLRTEKEAQLTYYAHYDMVTTLLNRRSFYEGITQLDATIKFYVFYIDVDGFKNVNDSLGHDIGDLVLTEISDRIKQILKGYVIPFPKKDRVVRGNQEAESIFRIGGDEFTAIIRFTDDIEEVTSLADRLIEEIRLPYYIRGNRILISSSLGISSYPKDTLDRNLLIRYADIAMYNAKKDGGSAYQLFNTKLEHVANTKLKLGNDLRLALDNQEFTLHYQPQVDCRDNSIIGVEALLRWNHPKKGQISPDSFIALAEDMGLIVPIGDWVLRQACMQMKLWRDAGFSPKRIAVNLSVKQFMDGKLAEKVLQVLEETGLDAQHLELEITENIAMKDEQFIILRELRNLGVTISIDDFGTHYSSLSYLKRFPVNKLKLDQSFVRGIQSDARDREMIKAIINVARSFELDIIAEGVETLEEMEFLVENGCSFIQGFYYYKPMVAIELTNVLRAVR
jgi:diguanylate cyclase (GGDEF)-like protein